MSSPRFRAAALATALSSIGLSQYMAVVLPVPAGHRYTVGNGSSSGAFAGYGVPQGATGFHDERALLWVKGQPIDVTPQGVAAAVIWNSRDGQHVGGVTPNTFSNFALAHLWFNDGSSVSLHPPQYSGSVALGCGGGKQVGEVVLSSTCFECGYFVERHSVLWSGSPESHVRLHAPGFNGARAVDTDGTTHVGSAYLAQLGQYRALLWQNPSGVINLHPASGFTSSFAFAVAGNSQVGYGETPSGDLHALLWQGSAASVIDLNPPGYSITVAYSVAGYMQVGGGRTIEYGPDRALAWRGSAASVIALHALLPEGFRLRNSIANDVDAAGNIIGTCSDDVTGSPRAVIWVPVRTSRR